MKAFLAYHDHDRKMKPLVTAPPRVKSNIHSNLPWESHACHPLLTGNLNFTSQPETHRGCNDHESETNTSNPPGCPCMRGGPGDLASRRADWATSAPTKPSAARRACALSLVWPVSRAPHVCEPCMWHPSPFTLTPVRASALWAWPQSPKSVPFTVRLLDRILDGRVLISKQEDVQHLHHMK